MKNQERKEAFVIQWMIRKDCGADILDADFVDDYIEEFHPRYGETPYGANKCPELGKLLSNMYKEGKLQRTVVGLNGMAGLGFPRWVYRYDIR